MLPEAGPGHPGVANDQGVHDSSAATAAGLLSARNSSQRAASSSSPIAAAAAPSAVQRPQEALVGLVLPRDRTVPVPAGAAKLVQTPVVASPGERIGANRIPRRQRTLGQRRPRGAVTREPGGEPRLGQRRPLARRWPRGWQEGRSPAGRQAGSLASCDHPAAALWAPSAGSGNGQPWPVSRSAKPSRSGQPVRSGACRPTSGPRRHGRPERPCPPRRPCPRCAGRRPSCCRPRRPP